VTHPDQSARRLAVVGPYPPYRGGIAQFTAALHSALEAEGHTVTGISFSRQYPGWLFPGRSQEVPTGAEAAAPDARRQLDSLRPWTGIRAARAAASSGATELIFMVWMPFFAPLYLLAARAARNRGMTTTAIVHNALPHEKQPLARPLMRALLRRMDRIITLTQSEAARCGRLAGRDADSITVSPHPVYDHFGAAMEPAAARRILSWPPEGACGLLFFGLIRRYKGLDLLLRALGALYRRSPGAPDFSLMIAGEFYEKERMYRDLVVREGLSDKVEICAQYIPDGEVAALFSAADLVVQPYRKATQSGVVQTAFHFGCPVVVSDAGGLADMVRDGEDGMVVRWRGESERGESERGEEDETVFVGALSYALEKALEPETLDRLTRGAVAARGRATWPGFARLFAQSGISMNPSRSQPCNMTR